MEGGQARPGGGVTGMSVGEGVALVAGVAVAAMGYTWWINRSRRGSAAQADAAVTTPTPTTKPTKPAKVCKACGKAESAERTLDRCGRCHKVRYCSRDCQRQDWGRHKAECTTTAPAAASKPTPPREPLPAWAKNMRLTDAEYATVTALLKKNDQQFENHLLRGGPTPDSVDGTWEGLDTDEANEIIDDSIWYKEFHKTSDTSRLLPLLRRLAAVQFWASSPVAVAFFSRLFAKQSEETLRSWIKECASELETDPWFRTSFIMFLCHGNTPACKACHEPVLALLSSGMDRLEAMAIFAKPVPDFVSRPLNEPLHSREAVDHMWANYYATGDVALIKKLIKEGLLLANQARMAMNPEDAQLLMQACNYAAISLVNEGIFDEQVRKVCQSERDALTSMAGQSQQSQLMQMVQHIMMQQESNIQQLAAIPQDVVRRMRVEVDGHRPFLERMREIKHRQKVARLKEMPGVRTVSTQFGDALWLPASAEHPDGLLFMVMEGRPE